MTWYRWLERIRITVRTKSCTPTFQVIRFVLSWRWICVSVWRQCSEWRRPNPNPNPNPDTTPCVIVHDRKSALDDLAPMLNVTFELACTATLASEAQPANAESLSLVTFDLIEKAERGA